MGVFWLGLATVLGAAAKPILFRVLAALGIGLATFGGSQVILGEAADIMNNQLAALPPTLANAFGLMNVDIFISLLISAYTFRLTFAQTIKWVRTSGN